MKILLIGEGGREHALAEAFFRKGHSVFCLPGNPGIKSLCLSQEKKHEEVSIFEHDALITLARDLDVDLTVVGPEVPLEEGIANEFIEEGLPLFGPTKEGARLETSKAFSKAFMEKYSIPTAQYRLCTTLKEASDTLDEYWNSWKGVVVKPDGLTAGKGVTVCHDRESAEVALQEMMEDHLYATAGNTVILEAPLNGVEVSVFALCDGKTIASMIPAQDYKRLLDGDKGPNTGGMGAYAPTPFADDAMMERIDRELIAPTLHGLQQEGIPYCGVLYFGVMLTEEGPHLLEYNCRFGDPEAQVVLPLLESDLAELMVACVHGELKKDPFDWEEGAACTVVLAAEGYPKNPIKGSTIDGINAANATPGCYVYHAGTGVSEFGNLQTTGGRVLAVTGKGASLPDAVECAYRGIDKIYFEKMQYRRDIAWQALKEVGAGV